MQEAHLRGASQGQGTEGSSSPRLFGAARNRGKNTTLIASMTLEGGMGEAMVIVKGTDAVAAFEGSVERFLAPSLRAEADRGDGQPRGA